jgi:hypothetical protein
MESFRHDPGFGRVMRLGCPCTTRGTPHHCRRRAVVSRTRHEKCRRSALTAPLQVSVFIAAPLFTPYMLGTLRLTYGPGRVYEKIPRPGAGDRIQREEG